MMKPRIVLESHNASYAEPIKVAKGAFLSLTGREDARNGQRWLWAAADDGREGRLPLRNLSERCPLLATSGLFGVMRRMSALPSKADLRG
jgi:hypothetical protein